MSARQEPNYDDTTYPRIDHTPDIPSPDWHHQNDTLDLPEHFLPAPCDFSAYDQPLSTFLPVDHDSNAMDQTPNVISNALDAHIEASTNISGVPSRPMLSYDTISDDTLLALTEPFLMAWCLPQPEASDMTSPWNEISSSSLVPFWGDSVLNSPIDRSSDYHMDPFVEIAQEFL